VEKPSNEAVGRSELRRIKFGWKATFRGQNDALGRKVFEAGIRVTAVTWNRFQEIGNLQQITHSLRSTKVGHPVYENSLLFRGTEIATVEQVCMLY